MSFGVYGLAWPLDGLAMDWYVHRLAWPQAVLAIGLLDHGLGWPWPGPVMVWAAVALFRLCLPGRGLTIDRAAHRLAWPRVSFNWLGMYWSGHGLCWAWPVLDRVWPGHGLV
jgi:hypothetical protein